MGKLKCVATLSSSSSLSSTTLSNSYIIASDENHHPSLFNQKDSVDNDDDDDLERKLTRHIPSLSIVSYTTSPVWSCVWSSDGQRLASCHGAPDSCVRIWMRRSSIHDNDDDDKDRREKESYILIATLKQDTSNSQKRQQQQQRTIRSAAFAPTISTHVRYILAVACFDGTVSIWEDFSTMDTKDITPTLQQDFVTKNGWECTAQLEGHENEVKDVCWNSTGTLLATCSRDKSVWIWECFLPGSIGGDGTGQKGYAAKINSGGGEGEYECIAVLHGHSGDVKCIRFGPSQGQWGDGDDILLSASYDDTIKCWAEDAGEWYCAMTLSNVHTSTIWSISLSMNGLRMISASADGTLAIWKCFSAMDRKTLYPLENSRVVCSTDGLWKNIGKISHSESSQLPIYSVDCCSSSKIGQNYFACTGSDGCIFVYKEVGNALGELPSYVADAFASCTHFSDVNCIRWHPMDGTRLVSCGDDGLIKIWRYESSS